MPVTMLVSYFPQQGKERAFLALLKKHWPELQSAGLVAPTAPQVWRATDKRTGRQYFVETFQWKDARASDTAHRTPEVMAVWEPMGPLLESMQLARIEPVALPATRKKSK